MFCIVTSIHFSWNFYFLHLNLSKCKACGRKVDIMLARTNKIFKNTLNLYTWNLRSSLRELIEKSFKGEICRKHNLAS